MYRIPAGRYNPLPNMNSAITEPPVQSKTPSDDRWVLLRIWGRLPKQYRDSLLEHAKQLLETSLKRSK